MDKVTLAHAAGIFDVRGSILLCKRYYINRLGDPSAKTLEVRLTGVKKVYSVQDYLKETFGGTITNYREKDRCWVLTGKKAQDFLVQIEPYFKNKERIKRASFIRRRYRVYGVQKWVQGKPKCIPKKLVARRLKMEQDWTTQFGYRKQYESA